jgi:hypothetical protein
LKRLKSFEGREMAVASVSMASDQRMSSTRTRFGGKSLINLGGNLDVIYLKLALYNISNGEIYGGGGHQSPEKQCQNKSPKMLIIRILKF